MKSHFIIAAAIAFVTILFGASGATAKTDNTSNTKISDKRFTFQEMRIKHVIRDKDIRRKSGKKRRSDRRRIRKTRKGERPPGSSGATTEGRDIANTASDVTVDAVTSRVVGVFAEAVSASISAPQSTTTTIVDA